MPAPNYPLIMGILNCTPDSFYDGGKYDEQNAASVRAEQMIAEGADIIDIGGESTGPNSVEVSEEEEMKRVIPVIKKFENEKPIATNNFRISAFPHFRISIDTTKAIVARAALDTGATMINDVSAGRYDPQMFLLAAKRGCRIILMYSKDPSPRTTIQNKQYDDVIKTVKAFLRERIASAESNGIARDNIIIDPGLGHFVSSDPRYSWEILERLGELAELGCRILVSPSRKSFTADHPGDPPTKRLPGTLRATELAIRNGASIIRTHDVGETLNMLRAYK